MGSALTSGVSGLRAHQTMLDVAGNNLANVNTLGYKAGRTTFADLLSQTLREASQPVGKIGGTNPIQVGSGAGVASVDRMMTQGGLLNTGQDLDMAVEGEGYFVLNSGQGDVYTRVGAFAVDSENYLVDPVTGYHVQRIGYEGVAEGFQNPADSNIRIPYDVTLAAKATERIDFSGNLSADQADATTSLLVSGVVYTAGGTPVTGDTKLSELDQTSGLVDDDEIHITGVDRAGNDVDSTFTIADAANTTLGELLTAISNAYDGSTASIVNGQIQLKDDAAGYSLTDLMLTHTAAGGADPAGTFELPTYFQILSPGGNAAQNTDVEIFDTQGISHILSASFVRTDQPNSWDMVLLSVTGGVEAVTDRRIKGITFLTDGSYGGMGGTPPDAESFQMVFSNDPGSTRTVTMGFGTVGEYDGVTLTGGSSTVSARGQDGYASGQLTSLSATREGVLMGLFTNGIRKKIAALKLATFQNPGGLIALGNNYLAASGNSGDPVLTRGLAGGAGAVSSGALEKSNVEVSAEFVDLIQAQNGFQANARTIRVANEVLQELANLIR
jgi:flagellar hook protein FlgE